MNATCQPSLALEERLQMAIEDNPYLARRKLRFQTAEGKVTLRGVVGSFFQKQMAQEAVRRIDGVEAIENLLEVNWSTLA